MRDSGIIGVVFGFNLTFEELKNNKIPKKYLYSIINNFESTEKIIYRMEYFVKDSFSLLMGPKYKKDKKDFKNVEEILDELTPLTIPNKYLDESYEILAKQIPLPENLPPEKIFGWVKKYSSKFDKFQLNLLYQDLPEYFLEKGGLPQEKLIPQSLGCLL